MQTIMCRGLCAEDYVQRIMCRGLCAEDLVYIDFEEFLSTRFMVWFRFSNLIY